MTTIKRWAVSCGLFIARWGGWQPDPPCARPHLPNDDQILLAEAIVRDVGRRYAEAPGAIRAREALRVLMNMRPDAKARDLNLLIELALQQVND